MIKSSWTFFCILAFFTSSLASAGSLTGELDRQQTSLDEPIWLTVSVEGSLDGDVIIPDTKDFEIQQSGQSTNISIINGSMSKQTQYTYQLRPLKEGSLTVPPFKARVDKQDLATEAMTVQVKGGVAQPTPGQPGSNEKLVSVERDLPKSILYEGEAVISKVRLLIRTRLTGATPTRDASPDWRLIGVDGQKNGEITRDGVRWSVIEMNEGLIPLKAGKLKVPPFGVKASWLQPSKRKSSPRSIFDMLQGGTFGMGEEVTRKLVSPSVEVTVKPLPTPKPQTFADIVGAFTLKAEVSKNSLNAGDTSTVTITVKGQGALDRMSDIKLNIPGAKIYADKPTLTESVQAGAGLVSTKIFKFAVVPQASGTLDLGTVKISSFNPFTEAYEELLSAIGTLTVAGETSPASTVITPGQSATKSADPPSTDHNQKSPSSPADLSAKTIGEGEGKLSRPWLLSPLAIALEILVLVSLIAFALLRHSWRRIKGPDQSILHTVKSPLVDALSILDAQKSEGVEIAVKALKEHLASRGQDPASMTSEDVLKAAEGRGLDSLHRESLRRVLAEMDKVAYGGATESEPVSSVDDLRNLLRYFQARSI